MEAKYFKQIMQTRLKTALITVPKNGLNSKQFSGGVNIHIVYLISLFFDCSYKYSIKIDADKFSFFFFFLFNKRYRDTVCFFNQYWFKDVAICKILAESWVWCLVHYSGQYVLCGLVLVSPWFLNYNSLKFCSAYGCCRGFVVQGNWLEVNVTHYTLVSSNTSVFLGATYFTAWSSCFILLWSVDMEMKKMFHLQTNVKG